MTAPNTQSVRPLRLKIRELAYKAMMLTGGKPGASKADQMIVLDNQIELLEEALATAKEARKIVAERDFDAYLAEKQAAKAAAKAAKLAEAQAAAPAAETLPGGFQEGQTFDQLIAQLADMPTDDQPKDDTPPF